EKDRVEVFVVRRRHPHTPAAGLPSISVLGTVGLLLGDVAMQVTLLGLRRPGTPPTVRRLFVERRVTLWRGNRIPSPGLLARRRIVGRDVSSDAVFASGHPDDHIVPRDQ